MKSTPSGAPASGILAVVLAALLAILLSALPAHAQANAAVSGSVESVGIGGYYRPGTWTPLVVSLRPSPGSSGNYQIVIEQEDLDRDLVSFTRNISLTAPAPGAGGSLNQSFTCYFLPQVVQRPENLRVYLCDEAGRRLTRLPVQVSPQSLEPQPGRRAAKLILYVSDGPSYPSTKDLAIRNDDGSERPPLLGVTEDLAIVRISPRTLPLSAIGYSPVDAIIWSAGAPPDPQQDERRYLALREWLTAGGRIVVMQHAEWRKTAAWADLLPVTFPRYGDIQGTIAQAELKNLTTLAGAMDSAGDRQIWTGLKGPHLIGVAAARPGALVEAEMDWGDRAPAPTTTASASRPVVDPNALPRSTPWLARHAVGAGVVTYVAQDLGSPQLSTAQPPPGWPRIWARVLDYRYSPLVQTKQTLPQEKDPLSIGRGSVEFGTMVRERMELTSRAGALIGVSILFFIVYFVVVGPGSWLVLRLKGKQEWSWLAFAALAGGATLLTLLIVRVVLRGSPELRHFTLVRVIAGEQTVVDARMGLYIPRDGSQRIELPPSTDRYATTLAPYALHPLHAADTDRFPAFRRYDLAVPDVAGDKPVSADIPYRSTAKRLQATWRGELSAAALSGDKAKGDTPATITGFAAVPAAPSNTLLSGSLTNSTGADLTNVYLIFRLQADRGNSDRIVYIPKWRDGEQFKLDSLTNAGRDGVAKPFNLPTGKPDGSTWGFDGTTVLYGQIGTGFEWDNWLKAPYGASLVGSDTTVDDSSSPYPRGWLILSLFDRLPFFKTVQDTYNRSELLRINARFLDVSPAVSGGRLVILAQANEAPLPLPLTVDGEEVRGKGTTLFQFVLPLDRSKEKAPDDDTPANDASSATTPSTAPPATPPPQQPRRR